jgi:hypothetical protein
VLVRQPLEDQHPLASTTLGAILALNPVTYNWTRESATTSPHTGFIAQEVQPIFPDLIAQGPDGYLTMNYAGLTPYLVKAVQQLMAQLSDLAATVANFADSFTTKELTFTRATGDEVDANTVKSKTLCLGATCVTESQLAAVLALVGQSATAPASTQVTSATASTTPYTPLTITIAGNNPAHITVGDTFNDLGATAKDSAGHDLGVKTLLNGALVSSIVLDASTTTTDTIDYVATDGTGLTATSTRTVYVDAPAAPNPTLAQ